MGLLMGIYGPFGERRPASGSFAFDSPSLRPWSQAFVMESLAQSSTSLRSAAGRAIIPAIITIIGL
jgi:hypothetical protein